MSENKFWRFFRNIWDKVTPRLHNIFKIWLFRMPWYISYMELVGIFDAINIKRVKCVLRYLVTPNIKKK